MCGFLKVEIIEKTDSSRNNWKPLFEVNFSKNCTKTIRLFALDFYEVIVDEAEGLIEYHLIEIRANNLIVKYLSNFTLTAIA